MSGKNKANEYIDTGALIGIEKYAYESPPPFPYKIREALSFARENQKKLCELSVEELEQFRVD